MFLFDFQMGDLSFDLRFEFVGGAAQFGEQLSGLTGNLRQLLWPEYDQGQEEEKDCLGKTHGLIIMRECAGGNVGCLYIHSIWVDVPMIPGDAQLLRGRLENDRISLVAGDDAVKLLEFFGLVDGHA